MSAATGNQIVGHFRDLSYQHKTVHNWGTCGPSCPESWDVPGTDTYINGVMLTIDQDYEMAHLLEVVERSSGMVSHLAVEIHHTDVYLWEWHEHRPYPFFERPEDLIQFDLHSWFINWYECNQETRREARNGS